MLDEEFAALFHEVPAIRVSAGNTARVPRPTGAGGVRVLPRRPTSATRARREVAGIDRLVNRPGEAPRTGSHGASPVVAVLRFEIAWGYVYSTHAGERIFAGHGQAAPAAGRAVQHGPDQGQAGGLAGEPADDLGAAAGLVEGPLDEVGMPAAVVVLRGEPQVGGQALAVGEQAFIAAG